MEWMRNKPKRPCAQPGCAETVERGYCEAHSKCRPGAGRLKTADRGYDATWRRFRAMFLRRHPLCADCMERGIPVQAVDVHHVKKLRDHPGLRCVEKNCIGLCHGCHSAKTAIGL